MSISNTLRGGLCAAAMVMIGACASEDDLARVEDEVASLNGRAEATAAKATAVEAAASSRIVAHAMDECRAELQTLCPEVAAGRGRVDQCLGENQPRLSERCNAAYLAAEPDWPEGG